MAHDEACDTEDEVAEVECGTAVTEAALFAEIESSTILSHLHKMLKATDPSEISAAAKEGMGHLQFKKTGSTSEATKHKSLRERWLTPSPKPVTEEGDLRDEEMFVKRDVHIKLQISEGRGRTKKTAVEDYRVLAIYTKTYNKWFLCEEGKQVWKKGMAKGKFRVLARMIGFDHSMGGYHDVDVANSLKWGKKSVYVICDACKIVDVVQFLRVA